MFWLLLFGPILIPLTVGVVLIVKLKNKLQVRANIVTPRFFGFFLDWGALMFIAWIVFVVIWTAISGGGQAQGPLWLAILLPWIFAVGAAFGVVRWYFKHYAT